jgi:hypothetical protein
MYAQDNYTLSGYVNDVRGEALIGATVYETDDMAGVVTNDYGFFSLTLPEGEHEIIVSYIGYEKNSYNIVLQQDKKLSVKLKPESREIEEVVINAESKKANIEKVQMGAEKLSMKTMKKLPVLMGETDVIKMIQLLPGVQTIGEGNSGFFVRGGSVDQNLILLDDATVYNPSHLGGFFSVFNGDAIKNVELYKGAPPAKYGGRLSSVLDVRMKEGSTEGFHGTGGIGAISSRLTLEGPVFSEKASFIVSGRRTYIDLFFPLAKDEMTRESRAYFYDLNGKINVALNDKNRVFLSVYGGRDVTGFGDLFEMSYGNQTATLRWNHVFNNKLFSNITALYSDFNYHLGQNVGAFSFDWEAHVIDKSVSNDYTYYINPDNTIHFGGQVTLHTIKPGDVNPGPESAFNQLILPTHEAFESNLFIENEHKLGFRWNVRYGYRFTAFNNVKGTIYNFDEEFRPLDSNKYSFGKPFNSYYGHEPRVGLRFRVNENISLKGSYNRSYQFIHLATNTAASTPIDVWFLSNPNIKPQSADQLALGYFQNFLNDGVELSVEAYYKEMYNVIDFKDHAELLLNPHFDGELRRGDGYSYGLELMAKKKQGDFTGWVSYTLSKTRRTIEDVNKGEEFPAPYDKPHDLKIVSSYDITNRLNIGATWVYASPLPMTVVKQWYQVENMWIPQYSKRNGTRLNGTAYHRMDLAATWKFKTKPGKNYKHDIMFSVYNLYGRHNLYSILYESDEGQAGPPTMKKMYLFSVIPTFTYNFKF